LLQSLWTIIMVAQRKILELLHQKRRSWRPRLEPQPPLGKVHAKPANTDFLVHAVVERDDGQEHALFERKYIGTMVLRMR
jgi:hypothetical protein